ncbi:hypothetical protein HYH96_17555 [Clostridium botulinum]|uniref:Uncharacterized protein n=1 Tax=Clostridium botulinum TaxID=1491 RepID=A0A846J7E5_CLOBO|nr:hypothetical protein [Clostridium botulinum]ACA57361.1 conserved hypothetical protein [Clostridium botulinum A3 str. Loch Maree]MBD5631115.1 hypothetical protein [Clostridium botulinum]MBD5645678.1 hypothetical protein [Clostridium botulinum]NFH65515.1 hypothetical protein [Clostridium botulinum]NFJ09372.1 hypothetical protein [Clostridium botulinum]
MEKLGVFKVVDNEYYAFYNNEIQNIDYFYKDIENNDVLCISINFNVINEISDIKTLIDFKIKYIELFKSLLLLSDDLASEYLNIQTFPMKFWKECVLTNFKNMKVTFIPNNNFKN